MSLDWDGYCLCACIERAVDLWGYIGRVVNLSGYKEMVICLCGCIEIAVDLCGYIEMVLCLHGNSANWNQRLLEDIHKSLLT